jgi:nitroreductase
MLLVTEIDPTAHRKAEYAIDGLFIRRWSPRAMSGAEISREELMTLFEAARWAPSSYNGQPWRFLYARRGTPAWQTFFDLLVKFNQRWVAKAAALIVVLSRKDFEHSGDDRGRKARAYRRPAERLAGD